MRHITVIALVLAALADGYSPAIAGVVRADWIALGVLALGGAAHALDPARSG